MTTTQIKMLCDDILIYLNRARDEDTDIECYPFRRTGGIDAAIEIVDYIRLYPKQAPENTESLYKIITGLKEVAIYFELTEAETALDLAQRFASRLYDDVREMRP